MRKVVIFGNSGAGKSTLARKIAREEGSPHLDLDVLAWKENVSPPERRPLGESVREIRGFTARHPAWVIEGCYSDLLAAVLPESTEAIFLNPGVEACIRNCRQRPWEPHKYSSPAAQDKNLDLLLAWVRAYETRQDEFSLASHRRLFDAHTGRKREVQSLQEPTSLAMRIENDDLTRPEIHALLEEHLRNMYEVTPAESVHALDLDGLRRPGITFWCAWEGPLLVGCGALKELDPEHGEVKSMRTPSALRRRGAGRALLAHIIDAARSRGYRRLSLETGSNAAFKAAQALYESAGFTYAGPFADYVDDPNKVFMTMQL